MSSREQPVVFLQVYSGQPDPSWPLEGEALAGVMERLGAARAQRTTETPPPPVLGYRGFRIENPAGGDLPATTTVWRGLVVAVVDNTTETWRDQADLETLLLEEARRRGYGELLKAAGAPPEPSPQTG
jgi:hypothetical protein